MSDNYWTFAAAIAGVVSGWVSTRLPKLDHAVYERVALLEERFTNLELDLKAANDEIEELKHK